MPAGRARRAPASHCPTVVCLIEFRTAIDAAETVWRKSALVWFAPDALTDQSEPIATKPNGNASVLDATGIVTRRIVMPGIVRMLPARFLRSGGKPRVHPGRMRSGESDQAGVFGAIDPI